MPTSDHELLVRFAEAVAELDRHFAGTTRRHDDKSADYQVRKWLDGSSTPLDWAGEFVTADEWFFITTLYGTMTLDGQRTHIRKFFSLFISQADRDIRNFTPELVQDWKLRSAWMKTRFVRMSEVLLRRGISISEYVEWLRELEQSATPQNLSPALLAIKRDTKAGEAKTLSVFVRDCVKGNCFPIDSRVKKELIKHGLPHEIVDEPLLVRLSISVGRNPRQVARMFYESGGQGAILS